MADDDSNLAKLFENVKKRKANELVDGDTEAPGVAPKRYAPVEEDYVVGIVEDRGAEAYRVDLLGASVPGNLGALAFDGATKRNRPQLAIGDAVFCRVERTTRGGEAQLSCCATRGSKKEWMTGAATFGKLAAGAACAVASVSPAFARRLLALPLNVEREERQERKRDLHKHAEGVRLGQQRAGAVERVQVAKLTRRQADLVRPRAVVRLQEIEQLQVGAIASGLPARPLVPRATVLVEPA